METPEKPQEAILKLGFSDGIYNKSKGGKTFSGWTCEHLPSLVELDNYGVSLHLGPPNTKGEFNGTSRVSEDGFVLRPISTKDCAYFFWPGDVGMLNQINLRKNLTWMFKCGFLRSHVYRTRPIQR